MEILLVYHNVNFSLCTAKRKLKEWGWSDTQLPVKEAGLKRVAEVQKELACSELIVRYRRVWSLLQSNR